MWIFGVKGCISGKTKEDLPRKVQHSRDVCDGLCPIAGLYQYGKRGAGALDIAE
jgi:hypothetical protein